MLDYSHFISLPLSVHSDLIQKLMKFQSTILGETEGDSDATGHPGDELESQSISLQLEVEERKDQVRVEIVERVSGSDSKSRNLSGTGS
jgi:activating signal cointegrator complex subunit 1